MGNIAQKCIEPRIKNVCLKSSSDRVGGQFSMHERKPNIYATRDPRAWALMLARYREASGARSTVELVITAGIRTFCAHAGCTARVS